MLAITCRSLLGLFRHFLLLFSNDSDIVRSAIVSNCKHVYKNRIRGKTKCNPFYYYACKWRFLFYHIPLIRHTLILDLDETLVYSCRFSDLSTMKPSLESIGVTIVFFFNFINLTHSFAKTNTFHFTCTNGLTLMSFWTRFANGSMSLSSQLEKSRTLTPFST